MKKLLTFAILLILFFKPANSVQGAPALGPTPQEEMGQAGELPLTEIGLDPFAILQGPFDQVNLVFQIPPDWQLLEGSSLQLNLAKSFSSLVPAQGEVSGEGLIAGNLTVSLDGVIVQRVVLQDNGLQDLQILLPSNLLGAEQTKRSHDLGIRWDASASCNFNLSTAVLILPESKMIFAFQDAPYVPDLSLLPYPFVMHNSPEEAESVIVLPTETSEAHMAAGLTFAAALGRLSQGKVQLDLIPEDRLSQEMKNTRHIIFVGPVEEFATLEGQSLPHENSALVRLSRSSDQDFGYIETLRSPWNEVRALLVISGSSDQAILNAVIQTGADELILNTERNLSILDDAPIQANVLQDFESATFSQLQIDDSIVSQFGKTRLEIPFYLSPDRQVSAEAFLNLRIAHSKLLDYLRSGVTVNVNGKPVGSMRLSDQSASKHSEIMLLPNSVLKPGINLLEIETDIFPRDICSSEVQANRWLSIFADSSINLLSAESQELPKRAKEDFGLFPMPFIKDGMQNTSVLLSGQNWDTWGQAAQLFLEIGSNFQTWPLLPVLRFTENNDFAELRGTDLLLSGHDLILIGEFDEFLSIGMIEEALSLTQKTPGTGEITLSSGANLNFDNSFELGYLEITQFNNGRNTVLAILGNSKESLSVAVATLLDPAFPDEQQGNTLLVVQDGEFISDSKVELDGAAEVGVPGGDLVDTSEPAEISTGKGPWLIPLLVLFAAGLVALVIVELRATLRRYR